MLNFNSRTVTIALILGFAISPGWGQTNAGAKHSPASSIDAPGNSRATLNKVDVVEGRSTIDVAITSSRPVTPIFSTLREPDRLVMDFPDTVSNLQTRRVEVNREGVRSIRVAVHDKVPPTTRVVVDLDQAPDYKVLQDGDQIVLKFSNSMTPAARSAKEISPADPPPPPVREAPSTPKPISLLALQQFPTNSRLMREARTTPREPGNTGQSGASVPPPVLSQASPAIPPPQPEADRPSATETPDKKSAPATPNAVTQAPVSRKPAGDLASDPAKPSLSETAANASAPPPAASAPDQAAPKPVMSEPVPEDSHASQTPSALPRSGGGNSKRTGVDSQFVIGSDDVLAINVWKEPEISRVIPVRTDGKISLPLLGDVEASGRTPEQLQEELAKRLKDFMLEPEVTVIVQEIKSQKFNIVGMVVRPGSYLVTNPMTVLDAIALAGGFRDFAKQKSIYILRSKPDGTRERLAFNYKQVVKGKNEDQNIQLEPRDTIVIP